MDWCVEAESPRCRSSRDRRSEESSTHRASEGLARLLGAGAKKAIAQICSKSCSCFPWAGAECAGTFHVVLEQLLLTLRLSWNTIVSVKQWEWGIHSLELLATVFQDCGLRDVKASRKSIHRASSVTLHAALYGIRRVPQRSLSRESLAPEAFVRDARRAAACEMLKMGSVFVFSETTTRLCTA